MRRLRGFLRREQRRKRVLGHLELGLAGLGGRERRAATPYPGRASARAPAGSGWRSRQANSSNAKPIAASEPRRADRPPQRARSARRDGRGADRAEQERRDQVRPAALVLLGRIAAATSCS